MNKVKKVGRRINLFLLKITVAIFLVACASIRESRSNGQLVVKEQGSFAVGGTVITNPGTFDPIKHGAFNPMAQSSEGQTLHGDHAYVFYQIPEGARKLPFLLIKKQINNTKSYILI